MRKFKFNILAAIFLPLLWACSPSGNGQPVESATIASTVIEPSPAPLSRVVTGAENLISNKSHLLKGKNIAIVANHTALTFDGIHLVDTLHGMGVNIVKIFAPEHGFRGDHDAGAKVDASVDGKTGIPIVSLYGKHKKPTAGSLAGVDIVIFDIQDVGARFYTYISTMSYVMEACAENKVQFMVLDRPNPNGWYVDGPVMESELTSFIGLHEIPIAHGMTIAEYAKMVNQEGWLGDGKKCTVATIPCLGYTHKMKWEDTGLTWTPPSPNLSSEYSAYLYPMLCWMEGMAVSVGRGTDHPFELFGAPWHEGFRYSWRKDSVMEFTTPSKIELYGLQLEILRFIPKSIPGKSTYPKFENEICWGAKFLNRVDGKNLFLAGLSLLANFKEEEGNVTMDQPLYRSSFNKLLGTTEIQGQIAKGMKPEEIYATWEHKKGLFKSMRSKYLLYADF